VVVLKVLIAEDNEDSRNLLVKQLQGYGHEVIAVTNGAEALQQAVNERPDIIVSDIMMPNMDGFQLCRLCKQIEQVRHIPFIFYTSSYTSDKDKQFGLSLGAVAFIRKPADPETLIRIIVEVCEKAKSGLLSPPEVAPLEPSDFFAEYSERLITKLDKKVAELEREVTERKLAQERIEHLNTMLHAIRKVNQLIVREKDRNRLIKSACDELVETCGYYNAWIALLDESGSLVTTAEAGLGKKFKPMVEMLKRGELPLSEQNALKQSGVMITEDPLSTCTDCPLSPLYEGRSGMTTRLEQEGKVYGVMTVSIPGGLATDEEEQALFREVTNDITFALYSIELEKGRNRAEEELEQSNEKLQKALEETVNVLASAFGKRDLYTSGHQQRVMQLACAIASEIGLTSRQMQGIHVAGSLHDIGKINVPTEILTKPGGINEHERGIIQMHPQVGYDIIKGVDFPWPVAQAVLQHHERLDGSGYPAGISGEAIIIEARVLAVADVVEAMLSHRPYREALGVDKALDEIRQNRGVLYDSQVTDACLRLFDEKGFELE